MPIVADVEAIDPTRLEPVDVLFASPPCLEHSVAQLKKHGVLTEEERRDAEIGKHILGFIKALRPQVVFIENVAAYLHHPVLRQLLADAAHLGYGSDTHRVVVTRFGVSQTRTRMVARLSRRPLPPMAPPVEPPSWYEALRGLLPTFPERPLAQWQMARVRRQFECGFNPVYPLLVSSNNGDNTAFCAGRATKVARDRDEVAFTVVATYKSMSATCVVAKDGRSTQVSRRGYARWQTFPDDYALPAENALATRVLGNAVPPRMSFELLRPFVGA
jgi:DNA (cytosine-5)-methyltransferase 1